MAGPYVGRDTGVGIGVESTFKTAVAASRWYRVTSFSMTPRRARAVIPDFDQSAGGFERYRAIVGEQVEFEMEIVGHYTGGGLELLHRLGMGGAWVDAGGPTYTHTLDPSVSIPSFTLRPILGSDASGAASLGAVISGCKISSLSLTCQAVEGDAAYTRCRIRGLGASLDSVGTAESPSYGTDNPILYSQIAKASWNSATHEVSQWTLELTSPIEGVREFAAQEFGEIWVTGQRTAQMTIQRLIRDNTFHTAHFAGTESDLVLTATGSSPDEVAWTLYNAEVIDPPTRGYSSAGLISETVVFRGRSAGGDDTLRVVFTNGNATAEAS